MSETILPYTVGRAADDALIASALQLLEKRVRYHEVLLDGPGPVKDLLRLRLSHLEHEVFAVVFLNAQSRMIECEEMFRGSVTQTSVHPREVVKRALVHNAVGVILAHNHPSGTPGPSRADEYLTQTLKQALALIDVRIMDHVIVAGSQTFSFAEHGLL